MIDLCLEGDKLLEAGTAAVYNKAIKGVRVAKGEPRVLFLWLGVAAYAQLR